jgi:hypothetical protein
MLSLPIFDLPTRSASGFMYRYIAPRMLPEVIMGPIARRPFFSLLMPPSDFVLATGHGNADTATGQDESIIWTIGKYNPNEVQGKVIKLVQCDTGSALGPDLVKNGALCYMGFDSDLIWVADDTYHAKPWEDPYSIACLGPIIDGIQALLDGQTCGESMDIEKTGFQNNAQDNEDFPLLQSSILFNLQHSVLCGNPDATIKPRPRIALPSPPPLII